MTTEKSNVFGKFGISFKDRTPLLCMEVNDYYICYDGKKLLKRTRQEINDIRNFKKNEDGTPSEYLYVKRQEREKYIKMYNLDPNIKEGDLFKHEYDQYIKDADIMKKLAKGKCKVNMYRTGNCRDAAMKFFLENVKEILEKKGMVPEVLSDKEVEYVEGCSNGGLIFAEPYTGLGYQFDGNSWYFNNYMHENLLVPLKVGTPKKLSADEFNYMKMKVKDHFFKIGIYRAKVTSPNKDPKWDKLFKFNIGNYYTHLDLTHAKNLGLNMDILQDGDDNAIIYERNQCLTGSELFRNFHVLYGIKREHPEVKHVAKGMLNGIWGKLCQRNTVNVYFKDDDYSIGEHGTKVRYRAIVNKDGEWIGDECLYKGKMFMTEYARLKPFLTARARIELAKVIAPIHEHVHRCHTDGFVCDIKPTHLKIGIEHGEFKLEKQGQIEVVNANKVIWT